MRIRHLLFLLPVAAIAGLVMASCGGDSTCDDPLILTAGRWCITLQSTQNNCSPPIPLDPTPYWADFTQSGTALNAVSQFGHTYSGTICGNNATMSGNNPGSTTTMTITFSDASNASGTVVWDIGTCSGTDTFTAVAGSCPP